MLILILALRRYQQVNQVVLSKVKLALDIGQILKYCKRKTVGIIHYSKINLPEVFNHFLSGGNSTPSTTCIMPLEAGMDAMMFAPFTLTFPSLTVIFT